jgi:hypothetical protein
MANDGYTDTPLIANSHWHVHDPARPQPALVVPGDPPSDAIVLFDGKDLSGWRGREGEAKWKVENGYMQVEPRTGDIRTKERFGDCQLHLEFASAAQVRGDSQGRSNSGVFMMGIYEIQVLDSYQNPTYADGLNASIYGQFPPQVNASLPPGEWQSYDIVWTAPRFDGPQLVSPAYLTLLHNGIAVHAHTELLGPTGHRDVYRYKAHAPTGPLRLQDHGDPVRFRNLWVRPLPGPDASA